MELNSSFANTDKTILAGTPMSITNDHQSFSSESSNSDIQKKKTCQVFCRHLKTVLLFFLVIVVTGLAIVLIVGSTKLNNKIEILEIKITSLEAKLNNSIFTSSARINNPENPATTPEFQQLQQLIEQLQDSIATINGSIRNTETEKRISVIAASVNRSILELEENLEEISDSLVDVNSTLRQTFAGCYEDRETCTLFPAQTDVYYRGCTTNELSSNIRGYYTVSMRCELETNSDGLLKPGQIEKLNYSNGPRVRCWCGFAYIENDNATATHGALYRGLAARCTIIVTRCPLIR